MDSSISSLPNLAIELFRSSGPLLFPNPIKERLILQDEHKREGFWEIRNSAGKRVRFGILEENMREISVESLDNGVYYLNLFMQEGENLDRAGFIKFSQ